MTPGTKFGRYEIRSKIGEGGMGEVYLALDTRLDRQVALKILPPELATQHDRMRRFVQEAKAASALNHPNIITIYEIDETASGHFIAIEFIDGLTLRERESKQALTLSESLDVAVQIASALVAAHDAGILHRDIKPENIMVRRDGIVKVLDFGLAKLTEPRSAASIDPEAPTRANVKTDPGVVMGTAIYMSPEQARGLPLDARTDIFSLGIVLYEMVAGRLPFEGANRNEIMASVLGDKEPQPLTRYSSEVPSELGRIVSKALRKNPDERYQTIKDLLLDLKSLQQQLEFERKLNSSAAPDTAAALSAPATQSVVRAPTVEPAITAAPTIQASSAEYIVRGFKRHKWATALALLIVIGGLIAAAIYLHARNSETAIESIAVLPFENQNKDPNDDYFSDGVTENIINSLSQLPNLKVMARTTVFRYKGRETDAQAIGKQLGVAAVLTGKVLRQGDTITIQADLIRISDGSEIWGDKYTRKLADLFAVQGDLAKEISDRLRLQLSGVDRQRLTKQATNNTEAYELYLKGYHSLLKFTDEGIAKSREYFQQAIDKDPNYAAPYAGLAEAYLDSTSTMDSAEASMNAKRAAQKAIALDPSLAEAHYALALVSFQYDLDWPASEREFQQAIKLNPNYAMAYDWYGYFLGMLGRFDEAHAQYKRGLELDPLSLPFNADLAACYYWERRYDDAIAQFNKTLEIDPTFPPALQFLAQTYAALGQYDKALEVFARSNSAATTFGTQGNIGYVYARSGRKVEAERVLADVQARLRSGRVASEELALVYTGLGDKDKAFAAWRATCRKLGSIQAVKVDPIFDSLRSDPRFPDLVRCVGLTP
jgi:serine/threonine-protein kinase